jgi:pyruvate dehydrogenase E1 component beta subunit
MAKKNYADAMLDVLRTVMEEDPHFVVMGNEVLGIGPQAMQFEPFQKEYPDRCYFPPCSEASFAALAAGAAMCGNRMLAHLGLAPFTYPAFSSIANEIAGARISSGGRLKVPVTLHISHGLIHGGGAQHSESPLNTYWNVPGIEIVAPSGAYEVKGLLRTALKSDNPTMVVTHAFIYGLEDDVPDEDYEIPFGEANVKREGGDVTVVGCSMMVPVALQAAEQLAGEGIEAEVIDLRTIRPLDTATIVDSVKRTNRLVSVEEGWPFAGIGAELGAVMMEQAFDWLDAPVMRVAGADVPLPYAANLERLALPHPEQIVAAARQACYRA